MKTSFFSKLVIIVLSVLYLSLATAAPSSNKTSALPDTLNAKQQKMFEQIIHRYIVNHPEVLIEASKVLEKRQRQSQQQATQAAIRQHQQQLFDAKSPAIGERKAAVNIVEFFDYQCVHCKKMSTIIAGLAKANKNVRVIYKQLPIFGERSDYAARAALAALKQDKYIAFHTALMETKQALSEKRVNSLAKTVGLDVKRLKKDIYSRDITEELRQNLQLAEALGIMGTPAMVVASHPLAANKEAYFIAGAASEQTLSKLIHQLQ